VPELAQQEARAGSAARLGEHRIALVIGPREQEEQLLDDELGRHVGTFEKGPKLVEARLAPQVRRSEDFREHPRELGQPA